MKNLKLPQRLALMALAVCFSAGLGKAQSVLAGKFTLPVDAHWGKAVLPAGNYTLTLRTAVDQYLLFVRGEGKSAIIPAYVTDTQETSGHSQLILVDAGGRQFIRTFDAGPLGLTFDYPLPKAARVERAARAELSLPVLPAGK